MKAQDLRVGNYVEINGETYILQDVGQFTVIAEQYKNPLTAGIFEYGLVEGIPLSEEWLVKFGFIRQPWGLIKDELLFRDNIKNPCKELTLEIGNGFRVMVKYVHQLQNLYYALTGKELEL